MQTVARAQRASAHPLHSHVACEEGGGHPLSTAAEVPGSWGKLRRTWCRPWRDRLGKQVGGPGRGNRLVGLGGERAHRAICNRGQEGANFGCTASWHVQQPPACRKVRQRECRYLNRTGSEGRGETGANRWGKARSWRQGRRNRGRTLDSKRRIVACCCFVGCVGVRPLVVRKDVGSSESGLPMPREFAEGGRRRVVALACRNA